MFRLERIKPFANLALYIALLVAYLWLRSVNLRAIPEVRQFKDTNAYLLVASTPLQDGAFWAGPRPWTVPLIYKLLDSAPQLVAKAQFALSVLSWSLLAICVARAIRFQWLGFIAFTIILVFGLSSEIIMWDSLMLSESISLSLMVLFIASWLWLAEEWQWRRSGIAVIVGLFWLFARETNAWVILMIAGVLALVGVMWRTQRRHLILAGIFATLFIAHDISSNVGQRWVFPFQNVLAQRILPFPERTAYFVERKMPVTPALMERSEKWASSDKSAFYNDPALAEFRDWLHKHGKSTYIRFLLSDLSSTIQEPLQNYETLITPNHAHKEPKGFSPILRDPLAEIIYFRKWTLLWTSVAGVVVGLAIAVATRERDARLFMTLMIVVLVYPHAAVVWHGDPMEVWRHSLQVGVQLRLGLWMLLLFGTDIALAEISLRTPLLTYLVSRASIITSAAISVMPSSADFFGIGRWSSTSRRLGAVVLLLALALSSRQLFASLLTNTASLRFLSALLADDSPQSYAEAGALYERALRWDSSSQAALRGQLGTEAARGNGDLEVADMLEWRPLDAMMLFGRGKRFRQAGQLSVAESHFRAAIAVEPTFFSPYFELAELYWQSDDGAEFTAIVTALEAQGNWSGAGFRPETDYARFGAASQTGMRSHRVQDDMWGNYWVGQLHRMQRNWGKAEVASRRLVSLDSEFHYAQLCWGEALYFAGEYAEAVSHLEAASKQLPDLFWPLYYLARCYDALGESQKARGARDLAAHKDPCYVPVRRIYDRNVYWQPASTLQQTMRMESDEGRCASGAQQYEKR